MQIGYLKILLLLIGCLILLGSTFKILKEYERAVFFRLGKLKGTRGPGIIFLIPLLDRMERVDLRLVSIDVPRQDIMTRDNVPATVDAVVYFQITEPAKAVVGIQNIYQSTFLLAQTALRSILGQVELDDLLSQQAQINQQLQQLITLHTNHWGVKIPIVEIKEVTLPEEMKRVMAKQAETERERRARIIDAQGEYQAAKTLAEAGQILSACPESLQLRYLQTLRDISAQKGSTILFPFPLDLITPFLKAVGKVFPKDEEKAPLPEPNAPLVFPKDEEKAPLPEPNAPLVFPQQEWLMNYQKAFRDGQLQPDYVQWISTTTCQFQCAHCEIVAQASKPSTAQELTTLEAKKMIDGLAKIGCKFLSISGGEPLLRQDLFELGRYAHQKGLKVGLTTNGQATEDHLAALEQVKFDSLLITIDGYKETLNRLRGNQEAYARGIRTIEFFHDLGAPSIGVSTTVIGENIWELPRLAEEAFQAGATTLQLQPLLFWHGRPQRNSSEEVKNAFRLVIEARRRGLAVELGEMFGFLGQLEPLVRSTPFFCGCGWNTLCITPEGKVRGCAAQKPSLQDEGNIRTESIQEIWGQKFTSFRRATPSGLTETCSQCRYLSFCRGGCWLFRAQGLNPCFLPEAEEVYQEITNALYSQTPQRKSQVLPGQN